MVKNSSDQLLINFQKQNAEKIEQEMKQLELIKSHRRSDNQD